MVIPWIKLRKVGFVTLVTLFVGIPVANASEWYRYQDDSGVLVMSHHVPPEYAARGYTVVNDDGRVLRVVPRQLSAEEIVIRDRELERQAELEAQRQLALQHDNELMQLYATPEEVEFARNRKLASIDESINALKRDIQQLRNKQRLYETQAAEKERGLMPVSREILTNLETVRHQIAKAQREIEARHEERERVQAEFGRDLNRIYELYGLPQPIAAT
jgi:hypothetical protein